MDRADPRGTTKRLFSLAGQETELLLDGKSQQLCQQSGQNQISVTCRRMILLRNEVIRMCSQRKIIL